MTSLAVLAPAKVNLYLAVGGVRSDGYHEVVTVMQSLSLTDRLLIAPAHELAISCEPDPCAVPEANLAYRAALALSEAVGRDPAVSITISKRIPAGAGLGGGSADAAAVLVGLAELWGVDAGDEAVLRVAASLGADVPFALTGGTALLRGRGDVLERRVPSASLHLALVNPGTPVSTADAYRELDLLPHETPPSPDVLLDAIGNDDSSAVGGALYNNMTPASVRLVPEVADAIGFLQAADGVLGAIMAGSGSTAFGIFADAEGATAAVRGARARGWWAETATSVDHGARVLQGERA